MNKVANLSKEQRKELFSETAALMNTTNAIVEKDFWVVWTLGKIFEDERLNKILMFKGGTSLSKVFNLIGRFSEDIDLILDWRLVTKENPLEEQQSKNKQAKLNEQINENAKIYIKNELLPIISQILSSFAALKFPQVFEKAKCNVNTIIAKRTFWEKATILHHEANRPHDSAMPIRYSRHYYDLAMMAGDKVKDDALEDLELLKNVVDFKQKFYPRSWAKYEQATPGTLKLLPPEFRLDALRKDYQAMQNMIFDKKISFDEIISILKKLESEINNTL